MSASINKKVPYNPSRIRFTSTSINKVFSPTQAIYIREIQEDEERGRQEEYGDDVSRDKHIHRIQGRLFFLWERNNDISPHAIGWFKAGGRFNGCLIEPDIREESVSGYLHITLRITPYVELGSYLLVL